MSTRWPHIRAALVAVHVLAVVLMAFPAPSGGMRRSAWKDPTVQAELHTWADRLGQDREAFEDRLWGVAVGFMDARKTVLKPFQPYYRYVGTTQSWRMFVAPHRFPGRLHIDVREDGAWRTVYVARDPELDWLGHKIDHDRMRSAIFRFAWKHYRKWFRDFADWLAVEAARDFPEAELVRLRYYKYRTLSPDEAAAGMEPEGDWLRGEVRQLEPLR